MNAEAPISTSEKKAKYNAILKEFIQVMLFLAFLGGMTLWFLKDYQKSRKVYICDAEQVELWFGKKQFVSGKSVFSGGNLQSNLWAHSGKNSIQLDASNPFGFEITFETLRGNEIVAISVWRYAEGRNLQDGQLLASIPGHFYEAAVEAKEFDENGWQRLELWFRLNASVTNKNLKIYCWNPTERKVWFDDLRIEMIRNP